MRVPRSDGRLPDRYVEVDLDWFDPDDDTCVEEFVRRAVPLWRGDRGECGVVLNPGFLVDVITEFSGDVDQELPLRSRRYDRWRRCRYRDLAELARALRTRAHEAGIADLRVGLFVAGVGRVITGSDLYDLESDWCDRHPELYPFDLSPLPGPDLDPRVRLRGDRHRYAAFPDGIPDGALFGEVLGAQWSAVADACDLDVIHLRDGFWGPMLYTRRGPYGVTAGPDPLENASWTTSVRDLFAAVKSAHPDATVMAYTSGIGATAEWRSGCVDTEVVLAGGGVDILIDQTWGGAWQDWWDDWWKGWTNQHANLLSHGVAVRRCGRDVRHYKLIETWDGWEPFDTVHVVPQKLRWAMWAWSHAATVTPDGLEVPDGTYVSWMNDRHRRLLDAEAVDFVADELGRAEADANRMTRVGGPLLVFSHDRVADVHAALPSEVVGEHVEDAAALLLKWGVPILAATDASWLASIDSAGGVVAQLGVASDHPSIAVGRADVLDAGSRRDAGVTSCGEKRPAGYRRERVHADVSSRPAWVFLAGDVHATADDADELASADDWPTAVARGQHAWWHPPELSDPANPLLPRSQYGSVTSAVALAQWWNRHDLDVRVAPVAEHLPVTVQWWESGTGRTVLVGNLEAGWVGDARTPRSITVTVREPDGTTFDQTIDTPPEGCTVHDLVTTSSSGAGLP